MYVSYMFTNIALAITTVCMLATYKRIYHAWMFTHLCTNYIANHSTYVAYIFYGTTNNLKELFPDNYYV